MLSLATWPVPWGTLQLVLLGLIGLVGFLLLAVAVIALLALRKPRARAVRRQVVRPAAPPAPGGAWLWVRSGPGAGAQHPLAHPATLLGSDPGAHVSTPHPQVAPRHATLSRQGEGFVLQDHDSPWGTFVNGQRIAGSVWVRPGDVINLGGAVELVLQA
jgi:hypothetical protein